MSVAPPLPRLRSNGTLADTAGDLVKTLNQILAQEALPPVPVASAPQIGRRRRPHPDERGFMPPPAGRCRNQTSIACSASFSLITGPYLRREPAVSRRRRRARPLRGRRLRVRRLHQQDRASGGKAARRARRRRALQGDLRPGHVPRQRQGDQQTYPRASPHHRQGRRRGRPQRDGRQFGDRHRHREPAVSPSSPSISAIPTSPSPARPRSSSSRISTRCGRRSPS